MWEFIAPEPKIVGAKRRLLIKAKVWKKARWDYEFTSSVDYGAFQLAPKWGVEMTY